MESVPRARGREQSTSDIFYHRSGRKGTCRSNILLSHKYDEWRYFSRPLQGKKFEFFRDLILGKKSVSSLESGDRSVLEDENFTGEESANGQIEEQP